MRVFLSDITKKFHSLRGGHKAVDQLSLEINDKEFFVLLGPSGCGKSTTLNLIAGLEKPSSGDIYIGDKLVVGNSVFMSPRERNVAMVFQDYALYPHLSVFENIAFPLRIQKMSKDTIVDSVERISEKLKLSSLLRSKPSELSGGERQRVAIARAIVRKPDIFLLDEPLSNLDAQLRASTRMELKELQHSLGVTTVYVTHDQVEAMTLGDRIAVLRDGKIEQIGTPDWLYDHPANTFVASFIGTPQINLFETEIYKKDGNFFTKNGDITIPEKKMAQAGNKCIVGIRPEHIRITKKESSRSMRAKIMTEEILGKDVVLHIELGDMRLNMVTHERGIKSGDQVFVELDSEKIHLFPIS